MKKYKGTILNHSSIPLFVIETDSGPARVHILGPKRKSPVGVDADGFKRVDGKTILGHKDWWKIIPLVEVNIHQIGADFIAPVSLIRPVSDQEFKSYSIVENEIWGVEMAYVTGVIRDKKKTVTSYVTSAYGIISKEKGIHLAKNGKLDNVVVVTNAAGKIHLRAKPNIVIKNNLG